MSEINFQVHDKILLTGAGFTCNFGTPLAKKIATKIFNHKQIQSQSRLRNLLKSNNDFEDVYDKVIKGNYSDAEKGAMIDAVRTAYDDIDEIVRTWAPDGNSRVNLDGVNELISHFAPPPSSKEKSFFFTLNQDLFIERRFSRTGTTLFYPGLMATPCTVGFSHKRALAKDDYLQVPTRDQLASYRKFGSSKFFYVKLHGSSHWNDAQCSRKLIIGKAKEDDIRNEPILDWYLRIFREVLQMASRKLLVIGYGFGDEHINNVIADAIKKSDLKLHVIDPTHNGPAEFKAFMSSKAKKKKKHRGSEVVKGLAGYYPENLSQIFPGNQSKLERKNLYKNFFEIPQPR